MKRFLLILTFISSVVIANSQNLIVEGSAPNIYVTHTVAPKEGFFSIARLYNQNPKTVASFNDLVMEKGLTIGQKIKIPLTSQNLGAGETASGNGSLIPLTHVVTKSETLFKLGADYNVTAAKIRKWNNLTSENIAPGTPLIVGHLKMTGTPPASSAAQAEAAVTKTLATTPKKEVTVEKAKSTEPEPKKDEPVATVEPVAKNETSTAIKPGGYGRQNETVTATEAKPEIKEEPVKEKAKKTPAVVDEPVVAKEAVAEPVVVEDPKEAPKTEQPKKSKKEDSRKVDYSNMGSVGSVEGVFAGVFTTETSKSLNTKTGEAATFKSTSGWQDKKYYVLMNDVTPGTILKIASAENKVVYAKVLGSMPEMKENNGLLLRISNAAASYLGIIDPKFPVQISYYQ